MTAYRHLPALPLRPVRSKLQHCLHRLKRQHGLCDCNDAFGNTCLPDVSANYAIFPHWDDLCTGPCVASTCTGCGVFTSISGTAPNRIFNIEWRANYYNTNTALNFEVRLYENSTNRRFDIIYGTLNGTGS